MKYVHVRWHTLDSIIYAFVRSCVFHVEGEIEVLHIPHIRGPLPRKEPERTLFKVPTRAKRIVRINTQHPYENGAAHTLTIGAIDHVDLHDSCPPPPRTSENELEGVTRWHDAVARMCTLSSGPHMWRTLLMDE